MVVRVKDVSPLQGRSARPVHPTLPTRITHYAPALQGDDYKAGRKSVSECVSIERDAGPIDAVGVTT